MSTGQDGFDPPSILPGADECALTKEILLTASDPQPCTGRARPGAPQYFSRPVLLALATVFALLAGSVSAAAQERYSYNVSLGPALGGSLDEGLGSTGFLGSFSWRTQPRTSVGIRFGSFDLSGEQVGSLVDPTLRYATISGEYHFQEIYYQSGVFFGLGLYQLGNGADSEEGAGLTLGVSGDFPLNERFSIVVELSGHYADIDADSTFGTLSAGVAYRF